MPKQRTYTLQQLSKVWEVKPKYGISQVRGYWVVKKIKGDGSTKLYACKVKDKWFVVMDLMNKRMVFDERANLHFELVRPADDFPPHIEFVNILNDQVYKLETAA